MLCDFIVLKLGFRFKYVLLFFRCRFCYIIFVSNSFFFWKYFLDGFRYYYSCVVVIFLLWVLRIYSMFLLNILIGFF